MGSWGQGMVWVGNIGVIETGPLRGVLLIDLLLLSLQSHKGMRTSPQHEVEVSSPWSVVTGPQVIRSFT